MSGAGPRYRRHTADERRGLLVAAAARVLAQGGIQGFTVARISREARVSQGLIGHHFGGKDGLLVELYRESLYGGIAARVAEASRRAEAAGAGPEGQLAALLEVTFAPAFFTRDTLHVWLALWGEIARNPALAAAHRQLYGAYRAEIAAAIGRLAAARGRAVEADRLALAFLALVDGLWLEWCLDAAAVDPARARAAAQAMLEAELGPLGG